MYYPRLKRWGIDLLAPVAALLLLGGCLSVTLVAPYDAQIDNGMTRYAQDLETFIAKMVAVNGQPQGTYQKNIDFYAEQSGRLGGLILRAQAQDPGHGCLLADKTLKILGKQIPAAVKPVAGARGGTAEGCTVMMIQNVKKQLALLAKLQKAIGGLNQATAIDVLNVSTQGIRAVLAVEILKKKGL
ncbi:MAG: hypothetical protein JKY27_12260 [Magnetovibrio sp.]|nr:hypothetical protein [Magnetovibrio sp.]